MQGDKPGGGKGSRGVGASLVVKVPGDFMARAGSADGQPRASVRRPGVGERRSTAGLTTPGRAAVVLVEFWTFG
jgi:hypothetical protein